MHILYTVSRWRAQRARVMDKPKGLLRLAEPPWAAFERLLWENAGCDHRVHRVATAAFWRTFSDEGKISPGWWGWGVHAHPLSLHLPSPVKLQCTLQLSGQIHWPCFISTNICTLWLWPTPGNIESPRRWTLYQSLAFVNHLVVASSLTSMNWTMDMWKVQDNSCILGQYFGEDSGVPIYSSSNPIRNRACKLYICTLLVQYRRGVDHRLYM